jgi:uncharacterized protein YceH (UPF0502 family)
MQAVFARLGARLGSGLLDAAANAAVVLQDAPEQVRRELRLFWDEVEREAQRLERDAAAAAADVDLAWPAGHDPGSPVPSAADVQQRIDGLRSQVAGFSRRLDQVS